MDAAKRLMRRSVRAVRLSLKACWVLYVLFLAGAVLEWVEGSPSKICTIILVVLFFGSWYLWMAPTGEKDNE